MAEAEFGLAHEAGTLRWGIWVCDCDRCRQVCLDNPDVVLVIKSSEARIAVTAGRLAALGAEAFLITTTREEERVRILSREEATAGGMSYSFPGELNAAQLDGTACARCGAPAASAGDGIAGPAMVPIMEGSSLFVCDPACPTKPAESGEQPRVPAGNRPVRILPPGVELG